MAVFDVLTAVEYQAGSEKKTRWTRIGAAFQAKDGVGFNVTLDALPVNGKLFIREKRDRGQGGGNGGGTNTDPIPF